MKIARRFTNSDQCVFDTLEWTTRSSRITNADGSLVFEMTDAEVPASWSQLATDIVVSKYFRKAGVPQTDADGNYVMTHLDETTLEAIADRTGGAYVRVDPESFGLDEVRGHLDQLSRAQRQETIEIDREEGFAFAIGPALLLLCLALALGDRRRRAG